MKHEAKARASAKDTRRVTPVLFRKKTTRPKSANTTNAKRKVQTEGSVFKELAEQRVKYYADQQDTYRDIGWTNRRKLTTTFEGLESNSKISVTVVYETGTQLQVIKCTDNQQHTSDTLSQKQKEIHNFVKTHYGLESVTNVHAPGVYLSVSLNITMN